MTPATDRAIRRAVVLMLLLAVPGTAAADMPMFPIFAAMRFSVWWTIPAALVIEAVALRWIFALDWGRAAVLSLAVNAVTMALGFVLYPVAGFALYPVLAPMVRAIAGSGGNVEFAATLIGAAVIDTGVELAALRWPFGLRITGRAAALFLLANLASAAVLVAALVWQVTPGRMPEAEVARVEAAYDPEIALMREMLDALPQQVTLGEEPWQTKWSGRDWIESKRDQVERLRFLSLTLRVPPATYSLAVTRFEAHRFVSLFEDEGRVVRGGFVRSSISGPAMGVVSYQIRRTVNGHLFTVTAWFRAPTSP